MDPRDSRCIEYERRQWLRRDGKQSFALARVREMETAFPDERKRAALRAREREDRAYDDEPEIGPEVLARLRWMVKGLKVELMLRRLRQKYSPDQLRVPAGNPDGGQWVGGNDRQILSDATPDPVRPGARYAGGPPRGGRGSGGRGQLPEGEPGQQIRLDAANARAQDAVARVRDLDPKWRPAAGLYGNGIESEIRKAEDIAEEAQARASELARVGIGPGPFAGESISARGPERDFTAQERREINRIGSETGCHTCGTFDPDTALGNYVVDHQPPSALNSLGRAQQLYPQCATCSALQGGWVRSLIRPR